MSPTIADLLADQLRRDPSRPLVTFYDDATGERIELSVTTYANWVAKTASLVQDELDIERGELLLLDLPTHWLGPVWLGAAWTLGLRVSSDPALLDAAGLVVCGPDGVENHARVATTKPVVAMSLRPLGARFADALPTGVIDYGAVVLGQPDSFIAVDPPAAEDEAWVADGGGGVDDDYARSSSQADLVAEARESGLVEAAGRLLTDVNPCTRAGIVTLLAPLLAGGGAVWVRNPDDAAWPGHAESERVTAQLRA